MAAVRRGAKIASSISGWSLCGARRQCSTKSWPAHEVSAKKPVTGTSSSLPGWCPPSFAADDEPVTVERQREAAERLLNIALLLDLRRDGPLQRAAAMLLDPTGLPQESQFFLVLVMDAVLGRSDDLGPLGVPVPGGDRRLTTHRDSG